MAVTAAMVKELREMTGAGMMDCKKALVEADGDMEKAVEILREKGLSTAAKKAGRIAAQGLVGIAISDDARKASIIEVNSETDFVAKNEEFITFVDKLAKLTLDDIRSSDYLTYDGGAVEKSDLKVQLKWLPQAQFMGYYVALDKGYYKDNGLNVEIVSGGGDVSETVAVSNGTVDFGVTWVSNLINANAGGMELLEVAQVYQRSGLVLCYKKSQFTK